HQRIRRQLVDDLAGSEPNDRMVLDRSLRLLAKYRAALIQNTFLKLCGTRVQGGPFAGMEFVSRSAEGCLLPKLLGCYEAELHGFLARLPEIAYETVLNIGCAEGYYAVGIKRLLPSARVI